VKQTDTIIIIAHIWFDLLTLIMLFYSVKSDILKYAKVTTYDVMISVLSLIVATPLLYRFHSQMHIAMVFVLI